MRTLILHLALCLAMTIPAWAQMPEGLDLAPAIYLDFEYHGGAIEAGNPGFYSRAPGVWTACGYIGNESLGMPTFAENAGVDGGDCLDKTANSGWGSYFGPMKFGSIAPGYDVPMEYALDNAWSLTICGWFKAEPGKDIDGDARFYYRNSQIELYATSGVFAGNLALSVPAFGGTNPTTLRVKTSTNDYSNPGQWVFYAASYDGTQSSNNVKFYKGGVDEPVYLVGTYTIDAGQLVGGERNDIMIGAGGPSTGIYSTAGYHDKFCVFSISEANSDGALDLAQLEQVRRWHLGVPTVMNDALIGDVDLDGDVDNDDIAVIQSSIAAGPIQDYYWNDGDIDGDLDVDQDDLDAANAHYTGPQTAPAIGLAVYDSLQKIQPEDVITPQVDPCTALWAARGEHECFQVAITPLTTRIDNVTLTVSDLAGSSGVLSADAISIKRQTSVRGSIDPYKHWSDPLLAESTGTARPSEPLVFWVDIDVPSSCPAGVYTGQVSVASPGRTPLTVPVQLKVWGFNVPMQQNLQTSFNLLRAPLRNFYGGGWQNADTDTYRDWLDFVCDYRLSPIDMSFGGEDPKNRFVEVTYTTGGQWVFDFSVLDDYLDYAISHGARNFNLADLGLHFWEPFWGYDEALGAERLFDDIFTFQYEEVFEQYILQAKAHYADDGPRPYTPYAFFYAFDELHPGEPDVLQGLIDRYDIVNALWPELRTLTTAEPARYPSFIGHVDIWSGKIPNYFTYTQPQEATIRALGNEVWFYVTGYHEPYVNFEMHEPGLHHRILFWQVHRHNGDGFLHWGLNVWPHYRAPNPWLTSMAAPDADDRWPEHAWDDAGWVIRDYTQGGGYLIYPGPDGPLPSIRLVQMRDGVEDWEYLHLLGQETSPGVWDGLIGRAMLEGVSAPIITQAQAAADYTDTVVSFTDYTDNVNVMEQRRRDLGDAIEALVQALGTQKPADLDNDGQIDADDIEIMIGQWLQFGPDLAADLDDNGVVDLADYAAIVELFHAGPTVIVPAPQAYFPFEGDSGNYGAGSESNPAWANRAVNPMALVNYIGTPAALSWPKISSDGVKGDCLDATGEFSSSASTMTLNYLNSDTVSIWGSSGGVQSYTICGWFNTRDAGLAGGDAYVMHAFNAGIALKWRGDGRLQMLDLGEWYYSDYGGFNSNGDWVFFAVTRNDDGVRYYAGSATNTVTLVSETTGLALANTPGPESRLVLCGYTYNGNDNYQDFDLDELRIFTNAASGSGALSLAQLELIRQNDLTP